MDRDDAMNNPSDEIRPAAYVVSPTAVTTRPRAIVHIVDDDATMRDSLSFQLGSEGFSVRCYDGAHQLLAAELPPLGCVLIDFHMPGINGLQLQTLLGERHVRLPTILMTAFGDMASAVQAMKAGAIDFLEKPFREGELVAAVRLACDRSQAIWDASQAAAVASSRIASLTAREHEVLDLLFLGKSNKEIAAILGTSPRTIDVHRARVQQKLQTRTLPDMVRLVLEARSS